MRLLATSTLALGIAGCVDDGWSEVKLAELYYSGGQPEVEAPTSGMTGASIIMTVTTVGGGCISFERTDVAVSEEGADIFPYNLIKHPGERSACPGCLRYLPHEATLTFETPGEKSIRVHGIRREGFQTQLVEVPLTIQVE